MPNDIRLGDGVCEAGFVSTRGMVDSKLGAMQCFRVVICARNCWQEKCLQIIFKNMRLCWIQK